MIHKLRRKFVLVATASAAVVLILLLLAVSIYNFADLSRKMDQRMDLIVEHDGTLPKHGRKDTDGPGKKRDDLPREAIYDTRFFVVYLNSNGQILNTDTGSIYSVDAQQAQDYGRTVLSADRAEGYLDGFRFCRVVLRQTDAIVFLDASRELDTIRTFLISCVGIALAALVLVAVTAFFLSPAAVKPITQAYEKQKRFVTNASHEIKTPLAVISANLDVLELHGSDRKWIQRSRQQVQRLTELVNRLVALSRMEEAAPLSLSRFSLSELCSDAAGHYQGLAQGAGKTFSVQIQPELSCYGDEAAISQLLGILLDNAFKYSSDGGLVRLSLTQQKQKKILCVYNTTDSIPIGRNDALFERFYREDPSRNSQTGGFGIGLSLARSIVEAHHGAIRADSTDGKSLTVRVWLP